MHRRHSSRTDVCDSLCRFPRTRDRVHRARKWRERLVYGLGEQILPKTIERRLNVASQILVPLVEKVAEHLTAIDEAHDNQVSYAGQVRS